MIETAPIQVGMHLHELTVGEKEIRIALGGFVQ